MKKYLIQIFILVFDARQEFSFVTVINEVQYANVWNKDLSNAFEILKC